MRTLALLALAALAGFAAGYHARRPPEAHLRQAGPWIQVYHRGQLAGEYDARDVAVWQVLHATAEGSVDALLPARLRPPAGRPLQAP